MSSNDENTTLLPSTSADIAVDGSSKKKSSYCMLFLKALITCAIVAGLALGFSAYQHGRSEPKKDKQSAPLSESAPLTCSHETPCLKSEPPFETEQGRADLIKHLPTLAFDLPFRMAGGYLKVHEKNNRNLYYLFVEADEDPFNKPLIVWQNGGPGSSSVGAGFFMSHGPVHLYYSNETLYQNPSSWNKIANVIWLENPVGVGFSYSNNTKDYWLINDEMQKRDTAHALQAFFKKFPEFKHCEVYTAGESYGGHYSPNMASEILNMNEIHKRYMETGEQPEDEDNYDYANHVYVNLKGFMVGNGLTNGNYDFLGTVENLHDQHYMSDKQFNLFKDNCDFSDFLRIVGGEFDKKNASLVTCFDTWNDVVAVNRDTFNIYNLHDPNVCHRSKIIDMHKKRCEMHADPTDYLNRKDVQEAIHADHTKINNGESVWRMTAALPGGSWKYDYDSVQEDLLPLYSKFLRDYPHLHMLIYSGSYDVILPTTGTLNWLRALKAKESMKTTIPWSSWSVDNTTVSGFTYSLDHRIRFASVLEAGHVVPMDQPVRALAMVKSFVTNTFLPNTKRS
eukprot:Nk52_evm8s248 gene=Nk52_evmTU8s248